MKIAVAMCCCYGRRKGDFQVKALVVGYGSIGRRHVRNLAEFDCIDEIIVYTTIKTDFAGTGGKKITFIDASILPLSDACKNLKIDFAVIANQTYKHIDTAIILAEKRFDLFIEKPLSHSLEKIDILEDISRTGGIRIFLAYNMRFLPAINYIKDQLSRNAIGDLYFARIEAGSYLPEWRNNAHYTDSYSSKRECGGGVGLDLSHEVDYMRYLFGGPSSWKTSKSRVGNLAIDSDDVFEGMYKYRQGFICTIHLDYLQRTPKRRIHIAGSDGYIICDIAEKWIELCAGKNVARTTEEGFFRMEDTYIAEMRSFIENKNSGTGSDAAINDGIRVLRLLEDGHD